MVTLVGPPVPGGSSNRWSYSCTYVLVLYLYVVSCATISRAWFGLAVRGSLSSSSYSIIAIRPTWFGSREMYCWFVAAAFNGRQTTRV